MSEIKQAQDYNLDDLSQAINLFQNNERLGNILVKNI